MANTSTGSETKNGLRIFPRGFAITGNHCTGYMFHVSCDWPYAPGWWALLVLQCPHSSFYTVERGRLDGYYSACCGLLGRPSDPTVIADPQLGPLDMKIEQCRDTGYKVGITQSLANYVLSSNNKVSNWFGRVFFHLQYCTLYDTFQEFLAGAFRLPVNNKCVVRVRLRWLRVLQ